MRAVFARGDAMVRADAMLQPPACVSVTAQAAHAACLSPRRAAGVAQRHRALRRCAGAALQRLAQTLCTAFLFGSRAAAVFCSVHRADAFN